MPTNEQIVTALIYLAQKIDRNESTITQDGLVEIRATQEAVEKILTEEREPYGTPEPE